MPAEIVGQVLGGNAPETEHPALQAAVVSVDILDVVDLALTLLLGVGRHATQFDTSSLGKRAVGTSVVRTQHCIRCQCRHQDRANVLGRARGQDHRQGLPGGPVASDQHGDLLTGQAALGCGFSTALGLAGHSAFLALETLSEKGLIRFHDPGQLHGVHFAHSFQKPVPPAKRRVLVHAQCLGGLSHGHPRNHVFRVGNVLFGIAEASQRRACDRGKGLGAVVATKALIALVATPFLEGSATAMRAASDVLGSFLQDHGAFNLALPRLQCLFELGALFRGHIADGREDFLNARLPHLLTPAQDLGEG